MRTENEIEAMKKAWILDPSFKCIGNSIPMDKITFYKESEIDFEFR